LKQESQAEREANPLTQLVAIPLLRRQVRPVEMSRGCGNNSRVSPNVKLGDARPLDVLGHRSSVSAAARLDPSIGQYITTSTTMFSRRGTG